MIRRQVKFQEILPQDVKTLVTRHGRKALRPFQPYGDMAQRGKGLEIAPGTAIKIEDCKRRPALHWLKQGRDVLADIMIAGSVPEILGPVVVVLKGEI